MTTTAQQPKAAKRPTTCGQMFAVDPTLGSEGCKRLPRHGGEHRAYLTLAAARRAEKAVVARKATKKAAPKGRKATKADLNGIVRDIRSQVGQARGRLNAAKRRQALGLLNAAAEAGVITFGDALGLTARF